MALLIAVLILALILAIAAVLIFREAQRMLELPPLAVIDPDDANEYVVANLDSIVAATLTHDDVRMILDAALEYLVAVGIANQGESPETGAPRVLDAVDFVIAKTSEPIASTSGPASGSDDAAGTAGESVAVFLTEQVEAVLDLLTVYMSRIGAVGRPATDDEVPPGA